MSFFASKLCSHATFEHEHNVGDESKVRQACYKSTSLTRKRPPPRTTIRP